MPTRCQCDSNVITTTANDDFSLLTNNLQNLQSYNGNHFPVGGLQRFIKGKTLHIYVTANMDNQLV